MLKVTKRFEYSLLALRHLACENRVCSAKEISYSTKVSYDLVSKLLQEMARCNLVSSENGSKGGYRLNKKASDISFSTIANALSESVNVVECACEEKNRCESKADCSIKPHMLKIHHQVQDIFDNATLEKIL